MHSLAFQTRKASSTQDHLFLGFKLSLETTQTKAETGKSICKPQSNLKQLFLITLDIKFIHAGLQTATANFKPFKCENLSRSLFEVLP